MQGDHSVREAILLGAWHIAASCLTREVRAWLCFVLYVRNF